MLWTNNCNYKPKNNEKFSRGWVTQILKANKDKYICIDIVDEEKEREGFELCGDLFFRLVNIKGNNQICRFAMNTSFVDSSNKYTFDKTGVDPDSIAKDKKFDNAFKSQWELFLKHVVADEPFRWSLLEGAKGLQLAQKGLESWKNGCWVELEDLED